MKPIAQEHSCGCGVACVAFLLKISYTRALKLFRNPAAANSKGYQIKEIIRILSKHKKQPYTLCYVGRNTQKIRMLIRQPEIILFLARSSKYPIGHYLASAPARGWMNPWINYPKIAPTPVRGGFEKRLPGRAIYAIVPQALLKQSS